MSEPVEMSKARNIFTRELEHFRRELVFTLRQYDSCPMTFEIKQHVRLRSMDLKPECLERYRRDTAKIANNQLPLIGNSLRIRSMCSTESPSILRRDEDSSYRLSHLPINKLTYESTRRATTNSHVLSFERQLIDDMDRIIDSIDNLNENNRHEWLRPSKTDRQRQYFNSMYDDTGYSLPLYNINPISLTNNQDDHWKWKYSHDKDDDRKTEVERFYDQYLSTSSYLNGSNSNNNNNDLLKDNYKPKTATYTTFMMQKEKEKLDDKDDGFDVTNSNNSKTTTTTRTSNRRYLSFLMDE